MNGLKEEIEFVYVNDWGDKIKCKYVFEGVLNNMVCCYKEIELNVVWEELVKYINNCLCLDCSGLCLCCEVCYVFLDKINLLMVVEKLIGEVLEFFEVFEFLG